MGDRWFFATKNPHKLAEVRQVIGAHLQIEALPPEMGEAPEPYETLYENALSKAAFYASQLHATVIAEDSGLFIPALGGLPGVKTAQFGGPLRVLELMKNEQRRQAYFVAVMVAYYSPGAYYIATGIWHGQIAERLAGQEGFGYDPIFIPEGEEKTVAELGNSWKILHSHRTQALHRLLRKMLRN